jgi:hypothetical protein
MPQLLICGEQTERTEAASGGRLQIGIAAGIKSEWIKSECPAGLNRNSQSIPIRLGCLNLQPLDPHLSKRSD